MSKIENEELYLDKKDVALDRLIERVEQAERALQVAVPLAAEFVTSDEFKRDVAPLFSDLGSNIMFLADLAENKDIVLPRLAEDLQAFNGGEKITLREFFEAEDENGLTPYEIILRKRSTEAEQSLIRKELAAERGIAPKKYYMPNNKLAQVFTDIIGEPVNLLVNRDKGITSYTFVDFVSDFSDKIKDQFDRVVYNALVSLWNQSPTACFSAANVWRAIPGNKDKDPSPTQLTKVERSIDRLRCLLIEVDVTEEWRSYRLIDKNSGEVVRFKENAIMLQEGTYENTNQHGTQKKKVYRFLSKPIIWRYAESINQYITAPTHHLEIKEVDTKGKVLDSQIPNTDDRMRIKEHFYRRIAVMKNDLKGAKERKRSYDARRKKDPTMPDKPLSKFCTQSRRIVFQEAFEEIGLDKTDITNATQRKQQERYRAYAMQCLDYWKADGVGVIKGYKPVRQGRGGNVYAVDIILL